VASYAIERHAVGAVIIFFVVYIIWIISYIWIWNNLKNDKEKSFFKFLKFCFWEISPVSGICNIIITIGAIVNIFFVICTIKYGLR